MARRVSWTNNSSGHNGTYVYRAPTLDPQNLPAPLATVEPVAQGATVEYVDTTGIGDQCYAVQDFEGESVSAVSAVYCYEAAPDYANATIGDEIGGGVYAGTITYADSRKFHLIFAKQDGELAPAVGDTRWKTTQTDTPSTNDGDDGVANTDSIVAAGVVDHPAAEHCVGYSAEGNSDWYLPARNELSLGDALVSMGHPEFSTETEAGRWSSDTGASGTARARIWSSGSLFNELKDATTNRVRPIRRVPV